MKKKKPSILLDLDNTALLFNEDGSYTIHSKIPLLLEEYDITLFSARSDIEKFALQWNVPYISKIFSEIFPKADFLIDDQCEYFKSKVQVQKSYSSINQFLRAQNK